MSATAESISRSLPPSGDQQHDYRALSPADRELLTLDVMDRWTRDLAPDDYTLAEVVDWERRRRRALATLRSNAQLTDTEFKLLRCLQRRQGRVTSYLLLARHLWQTPTYRVTAASLRSVGGFASPMVGHLHMLASSIRRKLEIDPVRPQHLGTVRGVGYIWYDEPPSLDDGINYAERATRIAGMQRVMHALIGDTGDPDAPVDHQLAAEAGLELEARRTIEGEYEPVEAERLARPD